jgi:hypothetical protein
MKKFEIPMSAFRKAAILLISAALLFAGVSCGGDDESGGKDGSSSVNDYDPGLDSAEALNTSINGIQFSIPSPIQTAMLLKKSGATFNPDLLNPTDKAASYATNFHKALNLGIYGADLAYITINGKTDVSMTYLTTVIKLAEELNVTGAFNEKIMNRFQDNLENQDSLLVLVGEAYRAGNAYLLTEERFDVIGLILTGGWLETMYFATNIARDKNDQNVVNRIGEQKSSLNSLIELLEKYRNDDLMDDLVTKLIELRVEFDKITYTYKYADPKTLPDKKITYITSSREVNISPESLSKIIEIISSIRTQIVS